MGAARRAGDFRVLYPKGADGIDDIPWFLQAAIEHGLSVLSWFENNQKEDIPPEYLWEDSEGLERWWELVDERRASRYGVTGTGTATDTTSEMTGNELASAFKGD